MTEQTQITVQGSLKEPLTVNPISGTMPLPAGREDLDYFKNEINEVSAKTGLFLDKVRAHKGNILALQNAGVNVTGLGFARMLGENATNVTAVTGQTVPVQGYSNEGRVA